MSDLQSLMSMGFTREKAEEALFETNNAGIEVAIEWLLITDGITGSQNKEDEDYAKAEVASLGEQLFDSHLEEAVRESLKETESKCDIQEATNSSEVPVDKKTRLTVRLLDGKTVSKVFNTQEKFNAVLIWIKSHISIEQFGLMTNFPKKIFTGEDYKLSLHELDLVPSATIFVTQPEQWDNLKVHEGVKTEDESRKVEEKRRKEEIEKRNKEIEEERVALERVRNQIEDDKAARRQRWPNLYQNSGEQLGNQILQNQPQGLTRPNQNRSVSKKFD